MNRRILLLSPSSYPWDVAAENTFLEPELSVMCREFDRVIVVPQDIRGKRASLPDGVEVEEGYAREAAGLTRMDLLRHAASTTLVLEDVVRASRHIGQGTALKRLVAHAGVAHHAKCWLIHFIRRQGLSPETCVVVTFWWTAVATGFALAKRELKGLRVVTRAHGYDLYEERHAPPYIPCRRASLRLLDGVFPVSNAGRDYIVARYGLRETPCETARLGLSDPGVRCPRSTDGVLRVVTCSFQVPIKRLDLLLEGLALLGRERPDLRVEWKHFGTGPLQAELTQQAQSILPPNVSLQFMGYSTQKDLFAWYGTHPVDVIANVSSSEGTPVSLMEAAACGIPILATAVGGNPEIATDANGLRLSATPSPEEIAHAVRRFAEEADAARAWGEGSRTLWSRQYDANANYRAFARILKEPLRS